MAKLKYRVRVLLGDQELVLLVPAAPETTVGELQTEVLARARRQGIIGSACAFSVDGALLDELDSVEDVLEVEQTIDARLSPRRVQLVRGRFGCIGTRGLQPRAAPHDRRYHASLAAFRRSPDGSRLLPPRVTPAKRPAPRLRRGACSGGRRRERRWGAGRRGLVAAPAPAPADADESDDEAPLAGGGAGGDGRSSAAGPHLVAPRSSLVRREDQRVRRD